MRKLFPVIIMLVLALMLASCGGKQNANGADTGTSNKENGKNERVTFEAGHSVDALLDYAKRLEKAGEKEAAEAIYNLIDKAAAADGIYDGKKSAYENSPLIMAEDLRAIAEKTEGK